MTPGPITSWYIATVWFGVRADTRQIVRLPAIDEADYHVRVRELWPDKVITFGPVSLSKDQG